MEDWFRDPTSRMNWKNAAKESPKQDGAYLVLQSFNNYPTTVRYYKSEVRRWQTVDVVLWWTEVPTPPENYEYPNDAVVCS